VTQPLPAATACGKPAHRAGAAQKGTGRYEYTGELSASRPTHQL